MKFDELYNSVIVNEGKMSTIRNLFKGRSKKAAPKHDIPFPRKETLVKPPELTPKARPKVDEYGRTKHMTPVQQRRISNTAKLIKQPSSKWSKGARGTPEKPLAVQAKKLTPVPGPHRPHPTRLDQKIEKLLKGLKLKESIMACEGIAKWIKKN